MDQPQEDKEHDDLAHAIRAHLDWLRDYDPAVMMRAARTWPTETAIPQCALRAARWRDSALALAAHSEEQLQQLPSVLLAGLFTNLGHLRQVLELLQGAPLAVGHNGPNIRDKARSLFNEGVDHHAIPSAISLLDAPRINDRLGLLDGKKAELATALSNTNQARVDYEEISAKCERAPRSAGIR